MLADLHAGVFEQQVNAAISDVAANVCTHGKKGEVVLKFTMKQIGDSNQVAMTHSMKFLVPTARGRIVEETAADTPLHVSKGGKLTLYPEEQREMFNREGAVQSGSTASH
ncbi:hypothetical protein HBF32_05945 [Luteibacter yeojuensis]|uniref:Uncharacterized protein n=1 Tax=Luteibacter yeojuensis TaxID=345309 RepID=A0A7X5QTB2_9GAMM|nr:hypothetical protein [Luteibacter yeojuensis]